MDTWIDEGGRQATDEEWAQMMEHEAQVQVERETMERDARRDNCAVHADDAREWRVFPRICSCDYRDIEYRNGIGKYVEIDFGGDDFDGTEEGWA